MAKYLWKSMKKGMKSDNGDVKWKLGQWQTHKGKLDMCESGFHVSEKIIDAMSFVPMEVLAKVEVKGKSIKQEDKQVWSQMRIVKAYKWTKKDSVSLAIYAAELILPFFEKEYPNDNRPRQAIEAAKKVLQNDTPINRRAAWAAAAPSWATHWAISWPMDAAYAAEAAKAAALTAAWKVYAAEAAESAAWAAYWAMSWQADAAKAAEVETTRNVKFLNKIEKWLLNRVKTLEEL